MEKAWARDVGKAYLVQRYKQRLAGTKPETYIGAAPGSRDTVTVTVLLKCCLDQQVTEDDDYTVMRGMCSSEAW